MIPAYKLTAKTNWGPRTEKECVETIELMDKRIIKRPGSANLYRKKKMEAQKNLQLLHEGAVFNIHRQRLELLAP